MMSGEDLQAKYLAWRGKAERYEQDIKLYKSFIMLQLALIIAATMTLVYVTR